MDEHEKNIIFLGSFSFLKEITLLGGLVFMNAQFAMTLY